MRLDSRMLLAGLALVCLLDLASCCGGGGGGGGGGMGGGGQGGMGGMGGGGARRARRGRAMGNRVAASGRPQPSVQQAPQNSQPQKPTDVSPNIINTINVNTVTNSVPPQRPQHSPGSGWPNTLSLDDIPEYVLEMELRRRLQTRSQLPPPSHHRPMYNRYGPMY